MKRSQVAVVVALAAGATLLSEMAAVRLLELLLGATALALTASSGAYLVTFGLGSYAASRAELAGTRPARRLATLQVAAAGWALASLFGWSSLQGAFDAFRRVLPEALSPLPPSLAALVALALPGAVAGSLVPLLSRLLARSKAPGGDVAWLLGWEAVGASAFALLAGFVLLRWLGLSASLGGAALAHLVAAVLLWRLLPEEARDEGEVAAPAPTVRGRRRRARPERREGDGGGWAIAAQLALAGFAGVGWQALWSRLLVLALPGSFAWPAVMVASWIGGSGGGAFLYHRSRWLRERPALTLGLGQLLCCAGGWAGASGGAWLSAALAAARPWGWPGLAELATAAVVSVPAAVAMGLTIPAAIDLLRPARLSTGQATGQALALDVAGAAVATLAVPALLIPSFGLSGGLLALGALQASAGVLLLWRGATPPGGSARLAVAASVVLAAAAALALSRADLDPWEQAPGGRGEVLRVIWGPEATATVVRDPAGPYRLVVDRHQGMGGEQGVFIERRQAHLPLLLHGAARSVAVIGVGTGNTLGAVTRHGGVRHVDAAENLSAVLGMLDLFGGTNEQLWRDGRVQIHNVDGRVMLRDAPPGSYDVVIGDLVHPWRAAATGLFAVEHLRMVRSRLAPGGLFCLWVPLHELDGDDLAMVAATFLEAFGGGVALLGHLGWRQPIVGLIAGGEADLLRRERLAGIIAANDRQLLDEVDLEQAEDLQSLYLGSTSWLRELAGASAVTSLERPLLAYRSTATWWQGTGGLGRATLARVLRGRRPVAEVAPGDEVATRRQRAVGVLLRAELAEAAEDLERAERGYREAARIDPEFRLPTIALELMRQRLERR